MKDFSPQTAAAGLADSTASEVIDLNSVKISAADKKEKNALIAKASHASRATNEVQK